MKILLYKTVHFLFYFLVGLSVILLGHAQNITFPGLNSRCDPLSFYNYGFCRILTCARTERLLPGRSYCDIYSRPFGRRLVRCVVNMPCCSYGGSCKPICNLSEYRLQSGNDCNARTSFCCVPVVNGTSVQQTVTTTATTTTTTIAAITTTTTAPITNRGARLQGPCGINSTVAPRILGGSVTRPTDYPWMVRFVYRQAPRNVCAGVLVDDDTVITVAHCISGFTASQLDVLVGDHDISRVDPGEELVPVNSLEISRNYVAGVRGNDFAVVKLARRVRFAPTKMAACLPDPRDLTAATNSSTSQCFVTGWGVDETGQVSSKLRSAPVQLMDLTNCNNILRSLGGGSNSVPSDMICTDTSATRSDACLFDDGGALTCVDANSRFTLIGLVSEYTCGSLPAIYTRVDNYTSAILARL